MARRLHILLALAGLVGLGLALAPTVAAGDPCYHGYAIPPTTSEATNTVKLEPCAFVPTITRIATGETVTFSNGSEFTHLVFGANARWGDRDREIPSGSGISLRFDQAGVYPYACALHRGMSGVVVVGDGGAGDSAVAAAMTPTGGDGGLGTAVAIGGLGALAVLGWALALLGRRRAAPDTAPSTTTG